MIFPLFIKGQDRDLDLESFAERFYQLQDDDLPYEQIYESLLQYYMHPVNLNKTSTEELLSLNILTPEQINHLMDHIRDHGPLISIYELQSIPSLSPEIIRDLLPFVTVRARHDSRSLWERIRAEENNYLLLRHFRTLQSKKGYQSDQNDPYLGDPNYFYARYRVSRTNDFSLGFTLEKDAGEQFFRNDSGSTSLADFQSYHFFLKDKGLLKALAFGDYQIQLGQGLVFGSGFSFGKGAEPIHTIRRNEIGLRPYTSALESGFFRGAGLALGNKHWTYTMIHSTINQDA
ncbi:MAG: helix-hairpin-helix domain-containing protein, partial [Cyclobacteriaceae bacterium]